MPYYQPPRRTPRRMVPFYTEPGPAVPRPPASPRPEPQAPDEARLAQRVRELEAALNAERERQNERERELEAALANERTHAAKLEAAVVAERDQAEEQCTKADSYLDLVQRTQADFLNYKRRVERDRADDGNIARADLLKDLLPVLDDLERALGQVPEDLREHPWAEGMVLIVRRLRLALAKVGIERIGAPGEAFDPHLHEALAYEPHTGRAEGEIATVVQSGYRLDGRIIRPAQVTVARGAAE